MRLGTPAALACLLLWAAESQAVAPIVSPPPAGGAGAAGPGLFRAPQRPEGVDRPERARALTTGRYGALVILAQFPDWPADTDNHPPAAFDSILFSLGKVPTGSLRDYYLEVSRGLFDIDGLVTPWITTARTYATYTSGASGLGAFPNNAQSMVIDAIDVLNSALFDFTPYDNDGPDGVPHSGDDDGFIDALFVVHAGPGDEEMGTGNHIYSHKWNLPVPLTTHDGIQVDAYTTEPEEWFGTAPYSQPGALQSIGVFCHEFGHILGLPDLYDTALANGESEGIGEWDLMGSGSYNHFTTDPLGTTPAHMSAWSKERLGWVTPVTLTQDLIGAAIPPVETTGTVYRLWKDGQMGSEYFLVENRQPIGFDSALIRATQEAGQGEAHGLLIYSVNNAVSGNGDAANKQVDVVESGGAEELSGGMGAQNLDIRRGSVAEQTPCGIPFTVTGNRGDGYDPWPGPLNHADFQSASCPPSAMRCGALSYVAVRNISESGTTVFADLHVASVSLRRLAVIVDDAPFGGHPNNGNGLAEPGETVRLRLPIENVGGTATPPLAGLLSSQDGYTTLASGALAYASIAPGAVDSGAVIEAAVNAAPDPRGASLGYSLSTAGGLVAADSAQVLIGLRTGLCDDFEGISRRWIGVPVACGSPSEWHRESGANHTDGGSWAWKLGFLGPSGNYAPSQDARLVSQPIRIGGVDDTLAFWHRFACEVDVDGLSIEISEDGGSTWALLLPVGGYTSGDRFSGLQFAFTQVKVPLTGYSGIVQIAFRFRSTPPIESSGWWIDDVVVSGDASCSTTAIAVVRFEGAPSPDGRGVRLDWILADAAASTVAIDRAAAGEGRRRLATLPAVESGGSFEDAAVSPGHTYEYWLVASREGEPDATAGPLRVTLPPAPGAPRALALGRIRPNPFNPRALAPVSLDRGGRFVLRVYRADGRLVRTLADEDRAAGVHEIPWDGTDDRGADVGSGIYLFELRSSDRVRVQKAILLR